MEPNISFYNFVYSIYQVSLNPQMDGHIHRFATDPFRPNDKDGWYIYYINSDIDIAVIGSWREGSQHEWTSRAARTEYDRELINRKKREIEEEKTALQEKTAEDVRKEYYELPIATGHPYLKAKGVGVHEGLKQSKDGSKLYIPLYDKTGSLVSYQYIYQDNDGKFQKRFKLGAKKKGCFYIFGDTGNAEKIFLCEGYATGASIYESTLTPTIVAFDGGNMKAVAEELDTLRDRLYVVADNDKKPEKEGNAGLKYAEDTKLPFAMIPVDGMDANDFAVAHGNEALKDFLYPRSSNYIERGDSFIQNKTSVVWLIKHWIPQQGLTLVFGASNSGKSFAVLDMALTLSAGLGSWHGFKAKKCVVLYLCGEGIQGVKGRIAIWKQFYGLEDLGEFYIAKGSRRLNEPLDLEYVKQQIALMGIKPDVIVVDTLARFFSGDENKANEMGGFINAVDELSRLYNCSIVLISHTGVSKEASERVRGSSALNAAADTSILITNENKVITLTQTKQKDVDMLEPLSFRLVGDTIEGWQDEDGEPITSAYLELYDKENTESNLVRYSEELGWFRRAWLKTKMEFANGYPYLTEKEVKNYLIDSLGWTRFKANGIFKNDRDSRTIAKLLKEGLLRREGEIYFILDPLSVAKCSIYKSSVPNVPTCAQ